eukprot:COSAG06_NODE_561_length_14287_cov_13.422047_9_plen_192_part_00
MGPRQQRGSASAQAVTECQQRMHYSLHQAHCTRLKPEHACMRMYAHNMMIQNTAVCTYVIRCQGDKRQSVPHSEAHDATATARYPMLMMIHVQYIRVRTVPPRGRTKQAHSAQNRGCSGGLPSPAKLVTAEVKISLVTFLFTYLPREYGVDQAPGATRGEHSALSRLTGGERKPLCSPRPRRCDTYIYLNT